jgi:hypothetical protein
MNSRSNNEFPLIFIPKKMTGNSSNAESFSVKTPSVLSGPHPILFEWIL